MFLSVTTGTGLIVDEVCEVLAALLRLQHHLVLQAGLAHPQLHATPPLVTQQLYKNKVIHRLKVEGKFKGSKK
jgi:hypothetical protein